MSIFVDSLRRINPSPENRSWIFVPYDQLTDEIGPLSRENPRDMGIILIENPWKAGRRPYHKQKLGLILSNMRHFALEQASRGVSIKYISTNGPYRLALEAAAKELGSVRVMVPAEMELRKDIEPLVKSGLITYLPNEGWMTNQDLLTKIEKPGPQWRMDAFYREARRSSGILMNGGKPIGGKFSHDTENRLPWKGFPTPNIFSGFPSDPIKNEVADLIQNKFRHHPGRLDMGSLPATKSDARTLWSWARENCLEWFGPYEDAMSYSSNTLFHTKISSVLNISRILPAQVVADVEHLDISLPSKEGFIRQVLGWREFVHHIHSRTNGFRSVQQDGEINFSASGDGGYSRWTGKEWSYSLIPSDLGAPSSPNWFQCDTPLPPAFWGAPSGLYCLDHVVSSVWDQAYGHHITRLMVIANIAALLDVIPRDLTDWFWVAYSDAFDWVVEPNVLGMGTYALGPMMTTKPYIAGANYINRMSDFCPNCRFDPKTNCPLTPMYWAFLARHESALINNPRMNIVLNAIRKRHSETRIKDQRIYEYVRTNLSERVPLDSNQITEILN
jgi:deoxyribodipyrimidine photolyase-related protein